MAKRVAYVEEGTELRNGQIVEDSGWYYVAMGQLIGPFATESEALAG